MVDKKQDTGEKIGNQAVSEAKDEFEFATNWRRVFIDIYQKLKWLNAYSQINELAAQKILKKFCKEHFEIKDNIIEK